jgi:outer membrane protein assembly factor BamB
MNKTTLVLTIFVFLATLTNAQVINNWRGPDRDGIYHETGLLASWPQGGPEIIWAFEDLGKGFTSPVPHHGKLYVTGMEGETGYVYVLSMDGILLQKFPYGKEIGGSYPGSRSTPLLTTDLLYLVTGLGELICIDLKTNTRNWARDLFNDFDGRSIRWGFTENLIIDGDVIYVHPGGRKHNALALNRINGKLLWSSEVQQELSAYCSPLLIHHKGRKILVNMMDKHIVGLDAATGKLLWSHPHANQRNIHPNSPIYHDNSLYCFSGYGKGGVKLKISPDGNSVTEEWINTSLDNQMGGTVLKDGYIYGSGDRNRRWFVVDWESGETVYETRDIDKGTVIYADGMLYAYTERGELALLEPLPGSIRLVSKTEVTLGSDQHWAHLVIHNGILFVRHGNALIAYNIRQG